ncbi:xylosidase [Tamlana sedimentorum]|uniref:Xylosidase n=1 Tax=Neotamlana sedimentorum TaxID=1435349 RepID=A0A0D7WET1_9FLAO|nr:family 43 glycosylhydrolase [Tamlana sedimentorum]KJD37218.1 xylosidase [Tamlana sedimentorum]
MMQKVKTFRGILRLMFSIFLLVTFKIEAQNIENVTVTYSVVTGIGEEEGVMRRDPSDVIKVNDLYYVWYSKGPIKTGYDATVWYATSPDGYQWTEKGMALAKGKPGSWEAGSVFTPNIMVAEGKYWLFYTGTSKKYGKGFNPDSKIGLAVSNSPDGPWERLFTNPILSNSNHPEDFDSHLIDDACLIARNNQYWLYYKGRKLGESPHYTKMGVAIANKPEGPYVKYNGNPVIKGGHAVLAWPKGKGVAAVIGKTGPDELLRAVLYSDDGFHFKKTHHVENGPDAGGAYRSNNFLDAGDAAPINWGVEIESTDTSLPFLHRYDLNWGN